MVNKKLKLYFVKKQFSIGFFESLTGGNICNSFTNIKGASLFVSGSLVLYQLQTKQNIINKKITNPNNKNQLIEIAKKTQQLLKSNIVVAVSGYIAKYNNNKPHANVVFLINNTIYFYVYNFYLSARKLNKFIITLWIKKKLYQHLRNIK